MEGRDYDRFIGLRQTTEKQKKCESRAEQPGSKQRKFVREIFWRVEGYLRGYVWRSFPYTNPRKSVEQPKNKY